MCGGQDELGSSDQSAQANLGDFQKCKAPDQSLSNLGVTFSCPQPALSSLRSVRARDEPSHARTPGEWKGRCWGKDPWPQRLFAEAQVPADGEAIYSKYQLVNGWWGTAQRDVISRVAGRL